MKFVHIADMHFDCPFTNISDENETGELRRLEQRNIFKKIINYIKENGIELFFISGDLYEQQYIKESTIKFIDNLFREIPNTKIFISPGNHDPFLKNSYYNNYNWSENVKIFNSKIEKIEIGEIDIYGFGFNDFYCKGCGINDFEVDDKEKVNILVMHADIDASINEEKQYNSVSKKVLESKNFDFIALGHIHKGNYNESENKKIMYPGSTISLGFDELGKHGMIAGDIEKNKLDIKFIPLDDNKFIEFEFDVTNIFSPEQLIENINALYFDRNKFIKIILIGKRNFEINIYNIYKLISNENIIKIKDKTRINYNLENIANEKTLKGFFVEEMLNKLKENDDIEKEIIEKAIEIGLEALN